MTLANLRSALTLGNLPFYKLPTSETCSRKSTALHARTHFYRNTHAWPAPREKNAPRFETRRLMALLRLLGGRPVFFQEKVGKSRAHTHDLRAYHTRTPT